MKELIHFAVTPQEITEEFRDYLKAKGFKIIGTYYGFCPYFYVLNTEDVTYYIKEA